MRRFDGRAAIITGGSLGLGRAIAERLTVEGANVLITGRDAKRINDAADEINALGGGQAVALVGDASKLEVVDRTIEVALEKWGRVDILVNNAGIAEEAPPLELSLEEWNYVIAVLLTAPFLLSQRAGRVMVEQRCGSIINISSIDGHLANGPYPAYGAAKAGLINLTKILAVELAPAGVRCNSISPGFVDTPMVAAGAWYEVMRRDFKRVPLRRLILPEEVAALCAFLASDEAAAITGCDYVIDGGTIADMHIYPTLKP